MNTNGIGLVIFDWAGTVIDFGCQAPLGAFIEVFARRGVTVSRAEAAQPMGRYKRDHLREMLDQPAISARWRERFGRAWSLPDLDEMYHELVPLQLVGVERYSQLVPDLLPCIAQLRERGIRIGGTTGYFREAADRTAEYARQAGYIPDVNVCGDDVPAGRPAPWMIFRCMEAAGVYPARRVVKVGDTPVDMAEGRNAGTWTVGVIDSSNEMGLPLNEFERLTSVERQSRRQIVADRLRQAGADWVIHSLAELPDIVSQIDRRSGQAL